MKCHFIMPHLPQMGRNARVKTHRAGYVYVAGDMNWELVYNNGNIKQVSDVM